MNIALSILAIFISLSLPIKANDKAKKEARIDSILNSRIDQLHKDSLRLEDLKRAVSDTRQQLENLNQAQSKETSNVDFVKWTILLIIAIVGFAEIKETIEYRDVIGTIICILVFSLLMFLIYTIT